MSLWERLFGRRKRADPPSPSDEETAAPPPPSPSPPPRPFGQSEPPPAFVWKARPIFISSTFKDMHAERDWLREHAFKALADRLRERCHYLDTIDLRQGVENAHEADEASRELQVLKVCLDEITRSRPFLIALLGDRYGWVPPPERITAAARAAGLPEAVVVAGKSVTELEILHGVLESADQKRRSWFYFRTLDRTGMPPEIAARFPAEEPSADPAAPAAKLRALEDRIRREMPARARTYTLCWDGETGALAGLEELDAMVERDLWTDLDAETAAYLREAPRTWQQADARALADFVSERTRGYVERTAVIGPLLAHALSPAAPDAAWGLVVTGESGSGKSSLFGTAFADLQAHAASGEVLLLTHAAGIFPLSGQVDRMLRRWVSELAAHLGVPDPLEQAAAPASVAADAPRPADGPAITSEQIEKTFAELLEQAAAGGRVVLLIDALDQFEATVRAGHLTWLPPDWPPNARLVATAIPATASAALAARPGCQALPVPAITRAEARVIATRFYRDRHHRDVNARVLDALLDKQGGGPSPGRPAHGNPLWLALALQEMNLLEADDFERADREFPALSGAERMEALQLAEAARLPADVPGVYGELLARAERWYGVAWTRAFTDLIALGRAGWREGDLRELMPRVAGCPWDDLAFAGVRRSLGTHVVQRGAQAQWDFFHAALRDTVLRRNLSEEPERQRLHGLLADYLEGLPPGDPLRSSETMVHLLGLGDQDRAAEYLAGADASRWSDPDAGAALAGAVAVLVQALQAAAADAQCDQLTEWIAGLLSSTDDERAGRVAHCVIFDLSDALEMTGAAQTEGPRGRLLEVAQARLAELRQRNPQSADYARDLSVSYERLGDLHRGLGHGDQALEFYQRSLALAEELRQLNPQSADYARDLSISYNKLGNLHLDMSHGDQALEFFQRSLALAEELRQRNPQSVDYARDLLVSYIELGDLHLGLGHGNQAQESYQRFLALEFYQRSLALAEELRQRNPQSAVYARDLSVSYERLGALHRGLGHGVQALELCQRSLALSEELRQRNSQSADYTRDLAVSCQRLGDLHRGLGQGDQALEFYRRSLALREELRQRNPQSADSARDLSVSYWRMADLAEESGSGDAPAWWRRAYETMVDMKQRGILLPADEKHLATLREKVRAK